MPKPYNKKVRRLRFTSPSNANLINNNSFQFAKKHALNIYPSNTIYTLIPKNACTSLRASIATANGFFDTSDNLKDRINWIHNNTYTFSAQIRELLRADYTFTILRCPFSRLASLFLDKFVDITPVAWNFYRNSNNAYPPETINFHKFIDLLQEQPHLRTSDIHWRCQTDFLIFKEYDDYFNFDNFSLIEPILENKIDLKLVDTRDITHHGKTKYRKLDGDYSQMSTADLKLLKNSGSLPSDASLYTPELKEKVFKLYESDFNIRNNLGMY